MLELHKNYTVKQLQEMYGPDWANILNVSILPKNFNKPVIKSFDDFDSDTKQKYIQIAQAIKKANPNENFNVYATGSRINGSWKTEQEAEQQAKKYNKDKVKKSDYDFITDAKNIPNFTGFNFKCDYRGNNIQTNIRVLIPKNVY